MPEARAPDLILASASPFRRRMLEQAGVAFRTVAADIDEATIKGRADASPADIAGQLARLKAEAVSARFPAALVIGADQVLAFEGEIFSKPRDAADARAQLLRLRGKTHRLPTAVALACGGKTVWNLVETPALHMRRFSAAFLDRYLADASGRVCATVGGYEIEGRGIQLFERIDGDTFTIIGLPLLPLLAELRARGVMPA